MEFKLEKYENLQRLYEESDENRKKRIDSIEARATKEAFLRYKRKNGREQEDKNEDRIKSEFDNLPISEKEKLINEICEECFSEFEVVPLRRKAYFRLTPTGCRNPGCAALFLLDKLENSRQELAEVPQNRIVAYFEHDLSYMPGISEYFGLIKEIYPCFNLKTKISYAYIPDTRRI